MQALEEPDQPKINRSARINHVLEQSNAVQQIQNKARTDAMEGMKQTMRSALMREVMPAVSEGIISLVEERPEDPLDFLSKFLLNWADEQENARADPYDAPIYTERIQLNSEKKVREQQRHEAKIAKMQREKEARIAHDHALHEMLIESLRKHESMLRS